MPVAAYLEALLHELRARAPRSPRTIFLGGGTPTYLDSSALERLLETIREATEFDPDHSEFTVEANPESATEEKLLLLRRGGANRISLGVQAMRDRLLRFFDRPHDVEGARRAVEAVRRAGFSNLNLDLIFGAPGQTLEDWRADLPAAVALGPDHLSLYDLTYEEGTTFRRWLDRGWLSPLPEEVCRELYLLTLETTEAAGFRQYEISNFARPGRECRHNLTYWRNEPYVGTGCGAASFVEGTRWRADPSVQVYTSAISSGTLPLLDRESLRGRARLGELLFLGLRLREGVLLPRLRRETGLDPSVVFEREILRFRERGLLELDEDRLRLTVEGMLVADTILETFVG